VIEMNNSENWPFKVRKTWKIAFLKLWLASARKHTRYYHYKNRQLFFIVAPCIS